MPDRNVSTLVVLALQEDLGEAGDLTTRYFLPKRARLEGAIVAKSPGVVCGLEVARFVFRTVSRAIRYRPRAKDGDRVRPGQVVATVEGPPSVLTAERTALNFIQRLSGVATQARAFVDRVRGTGVRILDTRKTTPGWRELEKYAVRCGGGTNHRMGLYDMVMLKDNHWTAAPDLAAAVRRFRQSKPGVRVLVEAKTRLEIDRGLAAGADILLLDNMAPGRLRAEIRRVRQRSPMTQIEVSGGVKLANVRRLALLGPDRISIGALTHSAPALDFSLEIGFNR